MIQFLTVEEAISYVETRSHPKKGFENFKKYLERKGNPQFQLSCIHIAGTNGKGSTTNYIRSLLQAHGLKVGTFTSPYLIVHNDRIRINDEYISDEDFLRIANEQVDDWETNELSMFEMDMSISIQYFIENKVDVAIYEVGIGGRFDATNHIKAEVGGITNIGMDHKEILGETYREIAYQKAGIMKDGMDVFTSEQKEECLDEFKKEAIIKGAKLHQTGNIELIQSKPNILFKYKDMQIELATYAKYQMYNASLAIDIASSYLKKKQIEREKDKIIEALSHSFWKGRMEIIYEEPRIVIDGAHNLEGIQALVDTVGHGEDIKILYGVLREKDYLAMYEKLKDINNDIIICFFDNNRSVQMNDLPKEYQQNVTSNYIEVIENAIKTKKDLLVCGSLYFISEVRKYIKNRPNT